MIKFPFIRKVHLRISRWKGGAPLKGKYIYRGQDITLDVLMKIEHVVRILSEREGREFDDMYQDFLGSKTYAALKKMESLLWAESAEFIADEYDRETH